MAKTIPHPAAHAHPHPEPATSSASCARWEQHKAQQRQVLPQLRAREAQLIGQVVQAEADLQDVRAQIISILAGERAGDQALAWQREQQATPPPASDEKPPTQE